MIHKNSYTVRFPADRKYFLNSSRCTTVDMELNAENTPIAEDLQNLILDEETGERVSKTERE